MKRRADGRCQPGDIDHGGVWVTQLNENLGATLEDAIKKLPAKASAEAPKDARGNPCQQSLKAGNSPH